MRFHVAIESSDRRSACGQDVDGLSDLLDMVLPALMDGDIITVRKFDDPELSIVGDG